LSSVERVLNCCSRVEVGIGMVNCSLFDLSNLI
jgi:hypothetical protein